MTDSDLHSLLRRQLLRQFGDLASVPDAWAGFIGIVNSAYREFDEDRNMLERSLDLSSAELLQANSEMRAVFEAFPDMFLWLDEHGRITNARVGDGRDLVVDASKIIGLRIQDLPDDAASAQFSAALEELRGEGLPKPIAYTITHSETDERRHYEARLLRLVDREVLAIIRNTTALRRAEEERLRASKIDSLGLLAGGIAHDFNNFLAIILSNLSLTRHSLDDIELVEELLSEAELGTRRARDLTKQLLTFSRGGEPVTTATEIGKLLAETVQFTLRGSNVRYHLEVPDNLPTVEADPGQIGQVIANLVINADEAMPDGGELRLAVSERCQDLPADLQPGCYVVTRVTDAGAGMQPAELARIFDPYYSTKQRGSGLGLATAWSVVRSHGGTLVVESMPGLGSTFEVWLPISLGPERKTDDRGVVAGRGRVLVMDDEEAIRRSTSRMLEKLGYRPEVASDGGEVLRAVAATLEKGSDPITAFILDLTVPGGMGGRETMTELQRTYPGARGIASSGFSTDPVLARYEDHGFVARLPKPYDLEALSLAVEAAVAGDR